jgi:hypothetical protein
MMRLHWFVPYRKTGRLRWIVGRIAPTWLSSPLRRIVQTAFFALFLVLFFYVCWPYGSPDYAEAMARRQFISAEFFLWLDPLLGISTAIAARAWVWALACGGIILGICIFIPRGFCGYVCPLGTLIDLFDFSLGRWTRRRHTGVGGRWTQLKYYILAATVALLFGVDRLLLAHVRRLGAEAVACLEALRDSGGSAVVADWALRQRNAETIRATRRKDCVMTLPVLARWVILSLALPGYRFKVCGVCRNPCQGR